MSYRRKRSSKRQGLINICISLSVVIVGLLAVALILTFSGSEEPPAPKKDVLNMVTVEAGTPSVDPEAFLKKPSDEAVSFVTSVTAEQLSQPGDYAVSLSWGEEIFNVTVRVVDTVAPKGTAVNLTSEGDLPAAADFVTDIQDVCPVTVSYKQEPDLTVAGEQDVVLVLTDTSGNETELTAKLTVELDQIPPQISGTADIVVYQGDAVSYRSGITVTDNKDENPRLNVDSSQVDLSTPGTYTVVYIATDASGNETRVEVTISVREKKPHYVELDVIYAEVDDLLEDIVTDGMTKREQVEAIYDWMYEYLWYRDSSDKSDYLQGAYVMMRDYQGDCFNYFALSKLMFERLGIDNIDVRKVKNYTGDADHFWSLVSLDGGETWYHFDATPRVGAGDEFCLVTDAFLDDYSESHDNSHNRDKSLYPATPEY